MRSFLGFAVALALYLLFAGDALAHTLDPNAVSGLVTAIQAHRWPDVVATGLLFLAWIVRVKAPMLHFFQTKWGAVVLSLVPSLFLLVSHTIMSSGFAWAPLVTSIGVFLVGLLVTSNPTAIKAGVPAQMIRKISASGMTSGPGLVLFLVLGGLALSSCTPTATSAWKSIGNGIKDKCIGIAQASQAFNDVIDQVEQPGATAASVAEAVALKDGVAAAICAAEQFVANAPGLFSDGKKLSSSDQLALDVAKYILSKREGLARKVSMMSGPSPSIPSPSIQARTTIYQRVPPPMVPAPIAARTMARMNARRLEQPVKIGPKAPPVDGQFDPERIGTGYGPVKP
jgi:hypothetical protein